MDKIGGNKDLNSETVEYELQVLVTKDDGESKKFVLKLKDYDRTRDLLGSRVCKFQAIQESKSDQIITSNKLLQFVPVEIISNVKRVFIEWAFHAMGRFPLETFVFEDLQELRLCSVSYNNSSYNLRHLPSEIGDLKNLLLLKISAFDCLEDLPSEIGNLENLEEFVVYECKSLLHLPSELGNLKRLRRLDISSCSKLQDLPSTIGDLESLEELSVNNCYHLTHFPSETSNLESLRKLNISSIAAFLDSTEEFRLECTNLVNLQEVRIYDCDSLEHLPQEIGNLRCLRKLSIELCNNLGYLPSEIGNLENLQELIIIDCIYINDFPPEIGNLKCLRRLEILRGGIFEEFRLESIQLEVGDLMSLQELSISYGGRLDRLALVINKLENHLQQMKIDYRKLDLSTGDVFFDLRFTMTLDELDFRDAGTIDDFNDFLKSLAAENSMSSPISLFLPQGIRCIIIEDSYMPYINQETIRKLLQKYPRLGKICSDQGEIFDYFSEDTLHLMCRNRFARLLQPVASASGDRSLPSLFSENVWPIILEEVYTRIRKGFIGTVENKNLKSPMTIGASVIYSIIREVALPLLVEH